LPPIAGFAVFFGATFDDTRSVAAEFADVSPSAFEAVTITRMRLSTSTSLSRYVRRVAPVMLLHPEPSAAQRCQR
jgi:predicted HAD superfamily phosphohydrolase